MKTIFSKDVVNKKMHVTREFAAPPEKTWKAWTESALLDQWWAPHPWKTETKTMDFREGGHWLYSMNGPAGEKMWSRADYIQVLPMRSFTGVDVFSDENGIPNASMPAMEWYVQFNQTAAGTRVDIEITFPTEKDLQATIEMGFEDGFSAAHENLDRLLASGVK